MRSAAGLKAVPLIRIFENYGDVAKARKHKRVRIRIWLQPYRPEQDLYRLLAPADFLCGRRLRSRIALVGAQIAHGGSIYVRFSLKGSSKNGRTEVLAVPCG